MFLMNWTDKKSWQRSGNYKKSQMEILKLKIIITVIKNLSSLAYWRW